MVVTRVPPCANAAAGAAAAVSAIARTATIRVARLISPQPQQPQVVDDVARLHPGVVREPWPPGSVDQQLVGGVQADPAADGLRRHVVGAPDRRELPVLPGEV